MDRLASVDGPEDVPEAWRGTPVERLLACHELNAPLDPPDRPELLVATCMDHRVDLRMPRDFAYVVRTGGANLTGRDFEVSFAVGVGGVRAVAIVGHSDCGMAGVTARREPFVEGLVEGAGWTPSEAGEHFAERASLHEIDDPIDFTLEQAERVRRRYPGLLVAALHYRVEDRRLYRIRSRG